MNEITKMVVVTTFICAFSATLLGSLKVGLEERIVRQEDIYVRGPTIHALLENSPNNPLDDKVVLELNGESVSIYPWVEDGIIRRIVLERVGQGGYGGEVTVMTAIDLESEKVYGVRVTQHKETPGVGTRVMEASFLEKFLKVSISDEIKLSSDGGQIDALSGATRTSTAVADGVNRAARLVVENKSDIIKAVTNAITEG